MLIGILSDTHGKNLLVRRALAQFDELGVEHIIHCGDVGGIEVFEEFIDRPFTFVWGNTDFRDDKITAFLDSVGIRRPSQIPTRIDLGGKRLAVYHGHEPGFDHALRTLDVDYIMHGHTHNARDEAIGDRRIINPGALHRARMRTVATLDTTSDELRFHELRNSD